MTHEQMLGLVRIQADAISERRIRDEEIKFWLFNGMVDFCAKTECSVQAYDYTITEENDEWRTDYPLPGFEAGLSGGETYPYAENTHAGSTCKRPLRLYIDGEMAEYTSIDRIYDPTATSPPQLGTDTQGEAISGTIFSGTGEDAHRQYWGIKYNKFWFPYPAVQEAVSARLHYVWVPNHAFKTAIEYASGSPSRMEVSQRIPEMWHDAIVSYAMAKLFALAGRDYRSQRIDYLREYNDKVADAFKQFKGLAPVAHVRGNYF